VFCDLTETAEKVQEFVGNTYPEVREIFLKREV